MSKKEKLAGDSWLQYSEAMFSFSHIFTTYSNFFFVFFFFVTWQRSEISSLYISTPWWWVTNKPAQAIEEGRKWNCSVLLLEKYCRHRELRGGTGQ